MSDTAFTDNVTPIPSTWLQAVNNLVYKLFGAVDGVDRTATTAKQALLLDMHGADIASAGTVSLDGSTGDLVDVTGTTTITAVTLAEGVEKTVRFTGALTLTHGASLLLPGAASITTAAGDYAVFRGYAAGVVRCVDYTKVGGLPITAGRSIVNLTSLLTAAIGAGTTNFIYTSGHSSVEFGIAMPYAGTMRNLRIATTGAPVGAETFIYTVRKNGVDTGLTVTITGAAVTGTDSTHTVSFSAGDTFTLKVVTSAGAAAVVHGAMIEYQQTT